MKINYKLIIAIAIIATITLTSALSQSSIHIGETAPDFILTTLDGKKVSIADYKSKALLLHFWGTWCPPCRAELPHMNELAEKLEKQSDGKLEFLAVAVSDTQNAVIDYMKRNGYTFNGGLDTMNAISLKYAVQAVPMSVLIGTDGKIEKIQVGAMTKSKLNDFVSKYVK